jgi:hypothetical protein
MTKPIKTLVLLLWLLFIKYCLYVLKSIVTYDMFKGLFYLRFEGIYIFNDAIMI